MSLDMFFKPRSIALIGATDHPLSIPFRILANLQEYGFRGPLYPVHPRHDQVKGLPAFKSIEEVPGPVDLAHVIVRNTLVPEVIRQCGRKGVRGAIINTSGFRETGPAGAALEEEVRQAGREAGVRLWGPNCQGCMNSDPQAPLYANFTFARMKPGRVSICAQGGGVAELINNHLAELGIGFRMYASNGNACDVSIPEILEYWNEDPGTRCIVLHAESFADPAAMLRTLSKIKTPVLALKSGTTAVGARAAASHTGGLLTADTASDLIFEKAGVLRFRTAQELCEAAQAFAAQSPPRGRRVAMLTNTGSLAIMAADEATPLGIEMPEPTTETQDHLKEKLFGMASLHNPVDMMATAGPEHFAAAAEALLADARFDLLLVTMVTPFFVDCEGVARELVRVASAQDKPVLVEVLTNDRWASTLEILRQGGLPTYYFPESAARAAAALCRYSELSGRVATDPPPPLEVNLTHARALTAHRDTDGWLTGEATAELLRAFGIPLVQERRVSTLDELGPEAATLGYPVVLKAEGPGLLHKSDAGAVALGITCENELRTAANQMMRVLGDATPRSFLLQRQAETGVELLVGASAVPGLGHSVAFGMGGVFVEVTRDVRFALAPLSADDANRLIRSIRSLPLLTGARGRPPVPLESLVDLLQRVGQLVTQLPEVKELDLNPVIASPRQVVAVDARVRV